MARVTLDPKLDIVFKILLGSPENRDILISFLTAVLRPSSPIVKIEILNPKIPGDDDLQRGIELDLRCYLFDTSYVNIEMQMEKLTGRPERWLYYWAGAFHEQLEPSDGYQLLEPNICIIIQNFVEFDTPRFHNTFRLLEVHDHTEFSAHLELHTLELPKLKSASPALDEQAVLDWGQFFAADDDTELERLAMNNPDIARAKQALDQLSADPETRRLAEARQRAVAEQQYQLRAAEERAKAEGAAEGLRDRIQHYCERFGIELTDARQDILAKATVDELRQLMDAVVVDHKWPAE